MQNIGGMPSAYAGLRDRRFDVWMIAGAPFVALASLAVVLVQPTLLLPILMLDLWLLGYHHVIATYTRIGLDRESWSKHWALVVVLPPVVFAAVLLIGWTGGATVLMTIYFYWLWFHYVRQSEGVSKAYAVQGGHRFISDDRLLRLTFYLVPTAAVLQISQTGGGLLLGVEVWAYQLPAPWLHAVWAAAGSALLLSARKLYVWYRAGEVSAHYSLFWLSHHLMFVVSYGLVRDLTTAWLCLNIWHNLQYLSFVWLSHEKRFKGSVSPRAKVLSTLVLPRNLWMYVLGCLALTFAFYLGAERVVAIVGTGLGVSMTLAVTMVYQTINFHHYIVDAIIWRRPKRHQG